MYIYASLGCYQNRSIATSILPCWYYNQAGEANNVAEHDFTWQKKWAPADLPCLKSSLIG